jgi:hypothetical protein
MIANVQYTGDKRDFQAKSSRKYLGKTLPLSTVINTVYAVCSKFLKIRRLLAANPNSFSIKFKHGSRSFTHVKKKRTMCEVFPLATPPERLPSYLVEPVQNQSCSELASKCLRNTALTTNWLCERTTFSMHVALILSCDSISVNGESLGNLFAVIKTNVHAASKSLEALGKQTNDLVLEGNCLFRSNGKHFANRIGL